MHSMSKEALRNTYLARRTGTDLRLLSIWSEEIMVLVLDWVATHAVSKVMIYASFRGEVATEGLISNFLAAGIRVFLPVCGKSGQMDAYEIRSLADLKPGAFGILEPVAENPVAPESLDLVLVPGCVFGRNMHRVGYGGGYYDRYLSRCLNARKAGLCYTMCLTEQIEPEKFDVAMDFLFTETGIILPEKGGKFGE